MRIWIIVVSGIICITGSWKMGGKQKAPEIISLIHHKHIPTKFF